MASQKKLIIITAPSGAGKTSITNYLLKKYESLSFSVSATTRAIRNGEVEGRDYYFISLESFQQKIHDNAFIEWEMVYEGKYYGTLKLELERIWNENKTPVLDIDVQGAIHVQQQFDEDAYSIFISPPSIQELERRLKSRGSETDESVKTRIGKAAYEISFEHQFDAIVVNENFDLACKQTETLIKNFLGERLT